MKTKIRTIRGELSIPISADLAASLQLRGGTEIEVAVKDGSIVARPLDGPRYSLAELLANVTAKNQHDEIHWGQPTGREVW